MKANKIFLSYHRQRMIIWLMSIVLVIGGPAQFALAIAPVDGKQSLNSNQGKDVARKDKSLPIKRPEPC